MNSLIDIADWEPLSGASVPQEEERRGPLDIGGWEPLTSYRPEVSTPSAPEEQPYGRAPLSFSKGAANLVKGIGWLVGSDTLENWGQEQEQRLAEMQMKDPDMARALQRYEKADGFLDTLKAFKEEPLALADLVVSSMPTIIPGLASGGGASIATRLAFNAARTAGATEATAVTAGRLAAEKWAATAAAAATEGVLSAGPTGAEVQDFLEQKGFSPEEAKSVATEAAVKTGIATTLMSGAFGTGALEGKLMSGQVTESGIKGALANIGKPALEEGLQNTYEDYVGVEGKRAAEPDMPFDAGKAFASGIMAGGVSAAPMHMAGRMTAGNIEQSVGPLEPGRTESPIAPVNADPGLEALDNAQSIDDAIAAFNEINQRTTDIDVGPAPESLALDEQTRMATTSNAMRSYVNGLSQEQRNTLQDLMNRAGNPELATPEREQAITDLNGLLNDSGVMQAAQAERATQQLLAKAESDETGSLRLVAPDQLPNVINPDSNELGQGQADFLRTLAQGLHLDVQFFEQEGGSKHLDGFSLADNPGTIFINRNSSGAASFLVTFGHEFTHTMPDDIRSAFIEAVKPELSEEHLKALDAYVNQPELSEAGKMEEIAADLFGNRFAEPEFWNRVFDRIGNPTVAERVVGFVRNVISNITTVLGGMMRRFQTDQYVAHLGSVREAAVTALSDYLNRQQGQGGESAVMFEVAPDPNNAELTSRWNALPADQKFAISSEVAQQVIPNVLRTIDVRGKMIPQLGGYLGETNPSFQLQLDPSSTPAQIERAAKFAGYTLSQDSMMVVTPKPGVAGAEKVGLITVAVPKDADVGALYKQIYQINNGEIQGHTTANGQMAMAVPLERVQELAEAVNAKLGGEYPVQTHEAYVSFIDKASYGQDEIQAPGRSQSAGYTAPSGPPVRGAYDRFRAEASGLLAQKLDAAERAAGVLPARTERAVTGPSRGPNYQAVAKLESVAARTREGMAQGIGKRNTQLALPEQPQPKPLAGKPDPLDQQIELRRRQARGELLSQKELAQANAPTIEKNPDAKIVLKSVERKGDQIGTRAPWAVASKRVGDPAKELLTTGLDAARLHPASFAKNVELMARYPTMPKVDERLPVEAKADDLINHMKDNLLWLHDLMPPNLRKRAKLWYDGANNIAHRWAAKNDIEPRTAAGVLAVFSPQKDWFQNVSLAERTIDIWKNHQDATWQPEMDGFVRKQEKTIRDDKKKSADEKTESLAILHDQQKSAQAAPMGQLSPMAQAFFVRAYSETFHDPGFRVVTPEGNFGDWKKQSNGTDKRGIAWPDYRTISKALAILNDSSIENISANLGSEHKVRNFYNNIIEPNSDAGHTTIDTHAIAAAHLSPMSGKSTEVKHNFGTGAGTGSSAAHGLSGTYSLNQEAYRRAAEDRNLLPREMQSITWEAVRGLFRPGQKRDQEIVGKINNLWKEYRNDEITIDQVRQGIAEAAGGIELPEWARPDSAVSAGDQQTSYQAKLRAGNGPDTAPGRVAGAGDRGVAAGAVPVQGVKKSTSRGLGNLTPAQKRAADNVLGKPETLQQQLNAFKTDWKKNLVQGVFDQFAPLKELDPKAYILARMSKGGDSTLEAMMLYGKVFVDKNGFYDVQYKQGQGMAGFAQAMAKLDGEHDRFFLWVAAQRAERLKQIGLENLFSAGDIAALQTLNSGTMKNGTARARAYSQALSDLMAFNSSVLKIAQDSGLIDAKTKQMYENTPYIPFYRLAEEGVTSPGTSSGLVNQEAWKRLKGGTAKLHDDLLANTLQNWSHLITASAKNRAAKASLDAAVRAGVATPVPSGAAGKGLVSYKEGGLDKTFRVNDPHVLDAITSLETAGLGAWSKPFVAMKKVLTMGVTVNPAFKIRNLLRDSVQAIATADLAYNPVENVAKGFKLTEKESETRAHMLAAGGIIRFGSMLDGNSAARVQELIKTGVDPANILDDDGKIARFWKEKIKPAFDAYQEFGDRGEQVNRAALYDRLVQKGMDHGEAAFWARDLMDFSGSGKWAAVRTITQIVPFMNARLQGLYKLGRASRQDIARFSYTLGAVALASIALMAAYSDDEDWNRREDWDRQNYWWFKVGNTAIRVPKPFEIGAIGTIAEMGAEWFMSSEMTGKRFMKNLGEIASNQLNMNPVPQLVKPMLDVYANQDSFTQRPIETPAMQRLLPQYRYNEHTSRVARFLGSMGLPDPAMLAMGHYRELSPVQVDAMLKGYFGWLGTMTTTAVDYGVRPLINEGDKPSMTLKDTFLVGNFAESLPSQQSRYLTTMYEQAAQIEQAYNSWRDALKSGDIEHARELYEEHAGEIAKYRLTERIKRDETRINQVMQQVMNSKTLSAETKRRMLDNLNRQREVIAQVAAR
jgi:hypothetical protein